MARLPRRSTGEAAPERLEASRAGEQRPRLGEKGPALGIEMHALLRPLEQGEAQLFFQLHDLPAERRLGQVQQFGGAADIALFGDGDEIAELAQIEHRRSVLQGLNFSLTSLGLTG